MDKAFNANQAEEHHVDPNQTKLQETLKFTMR